MSRRNATEETFELVTVLDKTMLFSEERIDRATVPKDLYMYEVRHSDGDWGAPAEVSRFVKANYFGTVISTEPLALRDDIYSSNPYHELDQETDWTYEGRLVTLKEYMAEYPPKVQKGPEKGDRSMPRDRGEER